MRDRVGDGSQKFWTLAASRPDRGRHDEAGLIYIVAVAITQLVLPPGRRIRQEAKEPCPWSQPRGSSTPRARALETVQAVKMQRMQPAQ